MALLSRSERRQRRQPIPLQDPWGRGMNGAMNANQPGDAAGNASLIPHPPSFFDTHAHLDQEDFDADRGAVIAGCRRGGRDGALRRGSRPPPAGPPASWRTNSACWRPSAFIPIRLAEALPQDWNEIAVLAGRSRVVALGETGLDRYRDFAPWRFSGNTSTGTCVCRAKRACRW